MSRDLGYIRLLLEDNENHLSPYASKSRESKGRSVPEDKSDLRTDFQRDRDRIVHSKAFRRIKHKTQVFIAPQGDHYVTRLTHTLEVSQIARTIARALRLNEDLTEAISLGHDMGHTPFGHIGEDELGRLYHGGFRHNQQSLRIVDHLEKEGRGLNLTWEVRQGIVHHSKPKGDFLNPSFVTNLSFEGQIVRIADAIAYLNHDLLDAYRAGILSESSLPRAITSVIGGSHSERINTMIVDVIRSFNCSVEPEESEPNIVISMSQGIRHGMNQLRQYMFENVYGPEDIGEEGQCAREIVRTLFHHFDSNRNLIPKEYRSRNYSEDRFVVDYVSGMTDQFAIRTAESINPGVASSFRGRFF
jgi:dGTPase